MRLLLALGICLTFAVLSTAIDTPVPVKVSDSDNSKETCFNIPVCTHIKNHLSYNEKLYELETRVSFESDARSLETSARTEFDAALNKDLLALGKKVMELEEQIKKL